MNFNNQKLKIKNDRRFFDLYLSIDQITIMLTTNINF